MTVAMQDLTLWHAVKFTDDNRNIFWNHASVHINNIHDFRMTGIIISVMFSSEYPELMKQKMVLSSVFLRLSNPDIP
jgi:hypothetical protein